MKNITKEVVDEIIKAENKCIMVLGGIDVGKTVLIENIAKFLSETTDLGIVDLDMGQSNIGPPTTVGWGMVRNGFENWDSVELKDIYFVGTTSPMKNLLPLITGSQFIIEKARYYSKKILIDTEGLVLGVIGRILKWNLISIVKPDIVIVFERENELDHIVEIYKNTKAFKIFRIPTPEESKEKSTSTRYNFRKRQFSQYFQNAKTFNISINQLSLRCYNGILIDTIPDLKNYIISLRNFYEEDLALGIIEEYDTERGVISITIPKDNLDGIRSIIIGGIKINKNGDELK
jgi:polynucleotide 5'-hydroxyl-kinase GRC3/NOL9